MPSHLDVSGRYSRQRQLSTRSRQVMATARPARAVHHQWPRPCQQYLGIAPNASWSASDRDDNGQASESDLLRGLGLGRRQSIQMRIRALNLSVSNEYSRELLTSPSTRRREPVGTLRDGWPPRQPRSGEDRGVGTRR